jgi:hypothetical protein
VILPLIVTGIIALLGGGLIAWLLWPIHPDDEDGSR